MNLYNKYILPKLTNYVCGGSPTMKQRAKIVPLACGNVLEIGIGSGLNLSYYDPKKVSSIIGVDPSIEMWNIAKNNKLDSNIQVEFIEGFAESLPFDKSTFDTVLVTYTLCSIPHLPSSLQEIKRVLKPGGQFLFCEHGLAPHLHVQKRQARLTPIWKKLGGGCNLDRKIDDIITNNGFNIKDLNTMYIPGWKFASYNYWGIAQPEIDL